jgi:hypothetical protein
MKALLQRRHVMWWLCLEGCWEWACAVPRAKGICIKGLRCKHDKRSSEWVIRGVIRHMWWSGNTFQITLAETHCGSLKQVALPTW